MDITASPTQFVARTRIFIAPPWPAWSGPLRSRLGKTARPPQCADQYGRRKRECAGIERRRDSKRPSRYTGELWPQWPALAFPGHPHRPANSGGGRGSPLCPRSASPIAASHHKTRRDSQSRKRRKISELQSPCNLVCRLLLEKKKKDNRRPQYISVKQHT